MFLKTKRNVLINLGQAVTIAKAASSDQHLTVAMQDRHFIKLRSLEGTSEELLDRIAEFIRSGQPVLEVDAVID